MRKIALLLSVAAAMVAVFGVVPAASAPKGHKEDVAAGATPADHTVNDIGGGGGGGENVAAAAVEPAKTVKSLPSSKQHNAKLLNRLGMKRVRTNGGGGGPNHHRKRLASQSRSKYGGADGGKGGSDSQMFIVKLPPHSHFYDDGSAAAAVHQRLQHQQHHHHYHYQPSPYKSLNTVPVGFVSNGKPGKVYHWNLPAIKHAMQAARHKQGGGGGGGGGGNNEVAANQPHHQPQYGQPGEFDQQPAAAAPVGSKTHAPRRTLYYKPRAAGKPVKKSFVNNGKPNGFYVVSNKNAAVPQYHKIVKAYYGTGDD